MTMNINRIKLYKIIAIHKINKDLQRKLVNNLSEVQEIQYFQIQPISMREIQLNIFDIANITTKVTFILNFIFLKVLVFFILMSYIIIIWLSFNLYFKNILFIYLF